jgi:hypothetical protein
MAAALATPAPRPAPADEQGDRLGFVVGRVLEVGVDVGVDVLAGSVGEAQERHDGAPLPREEQQRQDVDGGEISQVEWLHVDV